MNIKGKKTLFSKYSLVVTDDTFFKYAIIKRGDVTYKARCCICSNLDTPYCSGILTIRQSVIGILRWISSNQWLY